jgi:nucleoside diphosphate kinase
MKIITFKDTLKNKFENANIKTKRPEKMNEILDEISNIVRPDILEKNIISEIEEINDVNTLKILKNEITQKLSQRIPDDEDVIHTIKYVKKEIDPMFTSQSYTTVMKYLKSKGFKRENIDRKIVEMADKGIISPYDGQPLGTETPENPFYPEVDGAKKYHLSRLTLRETNIR